MTSRPVVARRWTEGRTVDLAAVAIALLVAVMAAADSEATGRVTGDALFWSLMLAVAGGVALWWRRRAPVWVAVALAPIAVVTDLVGGAIAIAVYTVAAYRRWGVTLAVAGLHAVAGVPFAVARPDPVLGGPGAVGLGAVVLVVTVVIGAAVRGRRERLARLRGEAARAEADAARADDRLRAEERERIAREMHDVLGHRISLVSLHAGALEIRPDLSSDDVARAAGTIRASAHQALEDLREILGVLRGESYELSPRPGLADLDRLVADCRAAGAVIEVDDRRPDLAVPASMSRTAYRLMQEGLTNATRHAPGAPVHVRLDRTADSELHVWLRNPLGPVCGPWAPGARAGLVGLTERVDLVGGRLDHGVRRDPDGGLAFHLEAWLPWPT
jgi:signal transduction histidine kinase